MAIQKVAKVEDGTVSSVIIVDTSSDFDYASLGYTLTDGNVSAGWIQQHDGFMPAAPGLVAINQTPTFVAISTTYAAKIATNIAANIVGNNAYKAAIAANESLAVAQAAYKAAYTAAGGT
jgi:hypothetical protein